MSKCLTLNHKQYITLADNPQAANMFSRFKHLQTLNIRNLPETKTISTYLPLTSMHKGIPSAFLDAAYPKPQSEASLPLKILAIGAVAFADVRFGCKYLPSTPDRDFLRLRVYRLEYGGLPLGRLSTRLTHIAEGTVEDAEGICKDLDTFKLYWLSYLRGSID